MGTTYENHPPSRRDVIIEQPLCCKNRNRTAVVAWKRAGGRSLPSEELGKGTGEVKRALKETQTNVQIKNN